jgi:hypothetical protein
MDIYSSEAQEADWSVKSLKRGPDWLLVLCLRLGLTSRSSPAAANTDDLIVGANTVRIKRGAKVTRAVYSRVEVETRRRVSIRYSTIIAVAADMVPTSIEYIYLVYVFPPNHPSDGEYFSSRYHEPCHPGQKQQKKIPAKLLPLPEAHTHTNTEQYPSTRPVPDSLFLSLATTNA